LINPFPKFLTEHEAAMSLYPYPYYWTIPEDNNTVFLQHTYPEHHHHFPHARHALADLTHNFLKDSIPAPRADVRETREAFYIDVELPGIECREQIKLKWTNSRTLVLEAEKTSRAINEGPTTGTAQESTKPPSATIGKPLRDNIEEVNSAPKNGAAQKVTNGDATGESHGEHEAPKTSIHYVLKERDLGKVVRAFHFSVSVCLDKMTAKLHHGMLEITVAKVEEEKVAPEHEEVHVEHDGN